MQKSVTPRARGSISRGTLIKGVLGIAGAGAGIMATASKAYAAPRYTTCCHRTAAPCPGCPGGPLNYKCYSDCFPGYSCICHADVGNCFTYQCA
jgi:hypothetical protein